VPSREEKTWQRHEAAKAMRKVRKESKRNHKPKPVRHRDWAAYSPEDGEAFDQIDFPNQERVMPRGERERRQMNLKKAMSALEEGEVDTAQDTSPLAEAQGQRGVVVEVSSGLCRVDLDGLSMACSLRGSLSAGETGYTNVVAVGDEVIVSENGSRRGVVEAVLPRRSVLARPDVYHGHLQQVIAANLDQLLVVASWREPHIWLELIDRYLIAAERYHLQPLICVNKVDLAEGVDEPREVLRPYRELNYRVIFTSALTGEGLDALRRALAGKTTVLAGLSGVGKSSLLSAIQPGLNLRTGEVSEQSREGRHTTTQVMMHRLGIGGFVVDTPGIREFGLSGLHRGDLAQFYPEISAAAQGCRFADCSHIDEPGCAVQAAVTRGRISGARYHSYAKIYQSLPA
jgi:ribosome biogenesis GTPase